MNEEVELILEDTKEKMQRTLRHLEGELTKIRAGRANVHMLDGITADYYGTLTPINQIANINTPDPRTIAIQPWEKTMIESIEKAILAANIGLTPINNGDLIRINIPILTEERRKELVRQVKNEGENTKVSIRNIRRDSNDHLKKLIKQGLAEDAEKNAEQSVQKLTDQYITQIDQTISAKEEEIMTI
ncbi:MAG: ribosome recycling factor [Bacteroidales bacterium]|nr:ribosome recycling factor [Bacteroidales bacterium]